MIRRTVGALLVLTLVSAYAPPAFAQQPPPARRSHTKLIWTIAGAAVGAFVAGSAAFHYKYVVHYPYYWSDRQRIVTSSVIGGGIGAAAGFVLASLLERRSEGGGPGGPHFVTIAEGLTSATLTEGIRVAPRQFTASQLVEACRDPQVIERLEVAPNPLEMRADSRYALNSLSVVAINAADVAMAEMPIVLEAEDVNPPIVGLRSDDPDLNAGRLHALRAGIFQMRIRTMCGTPHAEKIILGHVSP